MTNSEPVFVEVEVAEIFAEDLQVGDLIRFTHWDQTTLTFGEVDGMVVGFVADDEESSEMYAIHYLFGDPQRTQWVVFDRGDWLDLLNDSETEPRGFKRKYTFYEANREEEPEIS